MRIEGLQALKPQFAGNQSHQVRDASDCAQMSSSLEYLDCGGMDSSPSNYGQNGAHFAADIDGVDDIGLDRNSSEGRLDSLNPGSFPAADPSVTSKSGFDFEIQLEEREDDDGIDLGMGGWVVKICKAAVREPVSNKGPFESVIYFLIITHIRVMTMTCNSFYCEICH